MNAVILQPMDWRHYAQTITIEPTEQGQKTFGLISENVRAAQTRLTCFIANHPKVPLYGWQFCIPCGLWFGPSVDISILDPGDLF